MPAAVRVSWAVAGVVSGVWHAGRPEKIRGASRAASWGACRGASFSSSRVSLLWQTPGPEKTGLVELLAALGVPQTGAGGFFPTPTFWTNTVTLADKLNEYEVYGSTYQGSNSLQTDLDFELNDDGTAVDPEVQAFLDELDSYTVFLDAHPEGADRGGYVFYVKHNGETARHDPHDGCWC